MTKELTLFWSKLLIRLESKQAFLEQCRLLARLSVSVYHILLLIKVIQAEVEKNGLSVCIEMCIQALKMGVDDNEGCNISICKTISCLLPLDLEVKRACQLTEFLINPSLDSYYAVETLFNEPDQKLEQEDPPILNSLRCDLLLALKTKWPFDPEFWDWKTLKRQCLALMGQEATAILSTDKCTDSEDNEVHDHDEKYFQHLHFTDSPTCELSEVEAERKKKREMKKMREMGFVSARFRNWQAYMQYCVLCDKEFLGHRIVKHALKHVQDGIFRCPICTKTFETRVVLEPHVASHVKQSCKERLAAMGVSKKRPGLDTKLAAAGGTLKKEEHYIKTDVKVSQETISNNSIYASNGSPSTNVKSKIKLSSPKQGNPIRDVNNTEQCSCPVTSCQKVFKYFRNLVAHVKAHKNEQEATHFLEIQSQKALCQYCHRQFVNVTHLNDHLQMHCGEKPYFCIQLGCNCSFSSHAELQIHRKVHAEFRAQCAYPNCERIFNETYLLYDHEAQHYVTFSCKSHNCDKVFYTLSELDLHQKGHAQQEDHSAVDGASPSQLEELTPTIPALELPPSQITEVTQEFTPVEPKSTVESFVDTTQDFTEQPERPVSCTAQLTVGKNDSQTDAVQPDESETPPESTKQSHLESCYVKLEPIPIKCNDPIYLDAVKNADSETQTLLKDRKLFSFKWSQLKPSTLTSSPPVTKTNREEDLTHVCPFETCTRKYSTSKSLSRHVKNVHSEAFEEWKLSKKYKRIAEIAAKKSSSGHTAASSRIVKWTSRSRQTEHTTLLDSVIESPSSVFSNHDSMQSASAKFCSQLENTQSAATPNPTDLMQLPITQTWAAPSMENLDSGFPVHPYRSTILSENQQTNPSYHSDTVLDYTTASSYDDIVPLSANAHTPSSVMNEASKYVSSSLRVLHALNSEQTCDLPQVESSVNPGFSRVGQNHLSDISIGTLSGQNSSLYFPTLPSEAGPVSVQSLGNSNKEISTESTEPLLSSDVKHMLNPLSPHFKESSEDFFSAPPLTGEKSPEDFCNHELSQEGTEGIPSDDQNVSGSGDARKSKKIKSSKRTKWPAIIQDGKVICCRCYREFSSTKSLGGHLSKRSQCKPVDEIDLTADLPVSFLDFLNDPDISTVQMPLPMNDVLEDTHKSCVYAPSESNTFNNNTLTSMHGGTDSVQNTNMSPQDPSEMTRNYSFFHPPVSNAGIVIKPEAEIVSANTGEDGKIVEIERALQRLDLVDILSRDKCELKSENTNLRDHCSKAVTSVSDPCPTLEDPDQNEQKCVLKPFRCEEGCVYGAMTKEALFKHLSRVHDYSEDRINQLKKNPNKFAPYSCHLCSKTFTRTTGLKIHYKNVHHFSKEEVSLLKIGLGYRKIRKSTSKSENVHASLITDQGKDAVSEQFQHRISPNSTVTSVDSNAKGEANIVTKRKKKRPTQNSPTVSSTETSRAVQDSQKNVTLEVLPATCVKPPKDPSLTAENHVGVSNDPCTVAVQELSGGSPFLLATVVKAPDERTENATPQPNEQIEMNSNVMVDIQEKTTTPVDTFDSGDSGDAHVMFRPYRCVHEGCVAAFSIQQNLILHYRAMHQSERDEKNSAKETDGVVQVQEYRCQVKQCSKVVSKVTSLLKHYLLLHRCTLEKASALLSGVEVGTFQCDQSKCSAHFTCHLKYIDHIKNDHKAIKVSADGDFESVDLTFRCQFEGCDRVYTTKSNLLRHLMKKHDATFETMKEKQKSAIGDDAQAKKLSSNNGKENIANNNFKMKKKTPKKREDKVQNVRMALEKPALKSVDEASAMCNQSLPLEYPCMMESCDSVMSDEQSILKHYATHGLTDQCIEEHRSQLIFCMNSSEVPREDSTSKNVEVEEAAKVPVEDRTDNSNVAPQDVVPEPAAEVPVNESSTATTSPVVKRKRGRPRKSECRNKICVERKQSLRNCSGGHVKCMLKVSGSILNSSNSQGNQVEKDVALKLYKPSEFETSVLKFREDALLSNPSKRPRKLQPIIQERDQVKCVVNFRNPLRIETVRNVKIVMYENLSACSELLLKQLQDMQPLVILEKGLHS